MSVRLDAPIMNPKKSPGPGKCRDLCGKRGAEAHAEEIRQHWVGLGYLGIETWAEEEVVHYRNKVPGRIWVVRTNMVGGLPPREPVKREDLTCS